MNKWWAAGFVISMCSALAVHEHARFLREKNRTALWFRLYIEADSAHVACEWAHRRIIFPRDTAVVPL